MKPWNPVPVIAFAIAVVLGVSGASAQQPSSSQELIDGIIQDVINRTVDAARQEVRRNTGIDPLQRATTGQGVMSLPPPMLPSKPDANSRNSIRNTTAKSSSSKRSYSGS